MNTSISKSVGSIVVFLLLSISIQAADSLTTKLSDALKLPANEVGNQIYELTTKYIIDANIDSIPKNRAILISALSKSNLPDKKALIYEIEAHSARNLLVLNKAKAYAQKGLNEPNIPENMTIRFLMLLANIETGLENYLVAIENYQIIEKLLKDKKNQSKELIINFIGLADLYLKAGLYNEAITTLNKGITLAQKKKVPQVKPLLYKNMAIVYFYLGNANLLQHYTAKAFTGTEKLNHSSVSFHRLNYMKLMLARNPAAIEEIRKVINSPQDDDELMSGYHYAQALVKFNEIARAKKFILVMLNTGDLKNLTLLSSKLYKMLSDIYLKEGDFKSASLYYQKNAEKVSLYAEKQLKSGNMSALLKYHEIKNRYASVEKDLKVKKNYLWLSITLGAMIILALFLLYRTVLATKRFNKLAYDKLNNELSMINSHETRKHLSNILGILNVIKLSDDKCSSYLETETALFNSAIDLDTSIKSIAGKLSSYSK
ncbi:MAG: tetratricopeptide repeat protein [Pedobacter sp.]|uniref:tetratricopeptide repeat protein n=1 Tax=Bacteroidota TaxID=976 RepID=UPI00280983DE|nr:tetratricopeptide repeat protein [Pedobacter sp.]MDQ8005486.1 tetratricopeptide repeat protein [Pedobacter sp.]